MLNIMSRKPKMPEEKILDVDATMQGTMVFKDPVNLKINGGFEGTLNTRGTLAIGPNAIVKADIEGDDITIAGTVTGNIKAKTKLKIIAPAKVTGDIQTPILSISEGAAFDGKCQMQKAPGGVTINSSGSLNLEEVASYLEVTTSVINDWASQGKIPARKEQNNWRFEKALIDEWVLKEKVK